MIFFLFSALISTVAVAGKPCPDIYDPKIMGYGSPEQFLGPNLTEFGFQLQTEAVMGGVACHRLNEGDTATINLKDMFSPTRVSQAYRLKKTGPKSYRSEVRINLAPVPGENVSPAEIAKLREKISTCLKNQSPYLKGPGGEDLTIVLSEDQNVPVSNVAVTNEEIRADSEKYSTKSRCKTILHEILHLHGLVDEFQEETLAMNFNARTGQIEYIESKELDPAFGCRHLGPPSSVMRNGFKAMKEARDWVEWEYFVCIRKTPEEKNCPAGAPLEKRIVNLSPGEKLTNQHYLEENEILSPQPARAVRTIPRTRDSILEPAQFLSITRPGCREENNLYYLCSANAYLSKVKFSGGMGAPPKDAAAMAAQEAIWKNANDGCQPTPVECQDPNLWLSGAQPRELFR